MIEVIQMQAALIGDIDADADLTKIEAMARTCYASPMSTTKDERNAFIAKLVKAGHHSVLEHASVSVMLTVPRSISHQIVRHRVGVAYSQQSQRYVDLSKRPLQVIAPIPALEGTAFDIWYRTTETAASAYDVLIQGGARPQQARAVLPNCAATKIGMTANLRAWSHIFYERWKNPAADPAMRKIMGMVWDILAPLYPPVFSDH